MNAENPNPLALKTLQCLSYGSFAMLMHAMVWTGICALVTLWLSCLLLVALKEICAYFWQSRMKFSRSLKSAPRLKLQHNSLPLDLASSNPEQAHKSHTHRQEHELIHHRSSGAEQPYQILSEKHSEPPSFEFRCIIYAND